MLLKTEELNLSAGEVSLHGDLVVPENAKGVVVFVHGSGSSRFSPRNQHIASILQEENFATLLFDLLTREEEILDFQTREYRFDIDLLTKRLVAVTDWILKNGVCKNMRVGYFGASTGAAAAIKAAVLRPNAVAAVVSRGGRPDLAGESLPLLRAPILLIVGGLDFQVIQLNTDALKKITVEKELSVIPGATHLFEEPGTLASVGRLATFWFQRFMS